MLTSTSTMSSTLPQTLTTGDQLDDLASEEREVVLSIALLVLLAAVILSLFASHVAKIWHIEWGQSPLIATLTGALTGALVKYTFSKGPMMIDKILAFNVDVFFIALLPPIVFDSGFSLTGNKADHFFKNFGAILWFACLATLISFSAIGSIVFFAGKLKLSPIFNLQQSFALGAILSSTDPVAVLSIADRVNLHSTLIAIISGESLMNDAFSIVLYRTLAGSTRRRFVECLFEFLWVFFGSVTVGVGVGLLSALIYKYMNLHLESNRLLESALILIFPWVSYLAADGWGLTGIVAILFSGLAMSHYTAKNLSSVGRKTSHNAFGSLALLAETTVFVLLGVAIFGKSYPKQPDWRLYITTLVAVGSSRLISVYATSGVVNFWRRRNKLPLNFQHAICVCGVRGAVAFALALRCKRDFGDEIGSHILSTTLFCVVLTTCVLSAFLPWILRKLLKNDSTRYGTLDSGSLSRIELSSSIAAIPYQGHKSLFPPDPCENSDKCQSTDHDEESVNDDTSDSYNISQHQKKTTVAAREVKNQELNSDEMFDGLCGNFKWLICQLDSNILKPIFTHVTKEPVDASDTATKEISAYFKRGSPYLSKKSILTSENIKRNFTSFQPISPFFCPAISETDMLPSVQLSTTTTTNIAPHSV